MICDTQNLANFLRVIQACSSNDSNIFTANLLTVFSMHVQKHQLLSAGENGLYFPQPGQTRKKGSWNAPQRSIVANM